MTSSTTGMTVMLDEGAPIQADNPFWRRGHRVLHHNDVLSAGARDDHVVALAIAKDAVLIATDRDMKGFAKRFGAPSLNEKYEGLNLIFLDCRARLYEARIDQALDLIELEWAFRCQKSSRRMWISIEDHRLTTYR